MIAVSFHQPFSEQLAFFKQKVNLPTRRWDDIRREEHDRAFIVAGAQGADLLADLNSAVRKSIEQGLGLKEFRKDFAAIVQKHGWTGWTGEGSEAGVAWRTKVIYQTNMATSYAAGRYSQLTDPDFLKLRPYWRYVHNDSVLHPRPLHQHWGNIKLTLLHDHPFWTTHFPPNGWGCMCHVTAIASPAAGDATEPPPGWDQRNDLGRLPGIDSGFDYTPGKSVAEELRAVVAGKVVKLPRPLAAALAKDAAQVLSEVIVDLPVTLGGIVIAVASEIAGDSVERAVVLDPSGKSVLNKIGSLDEVPLTPEELKLLPNHAMVHNHPGKIPGSFSVDDVKLAIWHDMAEMHAVDSLYLYSLRRSSDASWGSEYWARVMIVWQRVMKDVADRLSNARRRGLIRPDEEAALLEHMTWMEVDAELSIGYSRTLRTELEP